MSSHLLVPLDGTAESARALPVAGVLAGLTSADLTLLRVVPGGSSPAVITEAAAYLDGAAASTASARVHVRTLVRTGDPADAILAATRDDGTGFVVMGTHARSGFDRLRFGSVAERVIAGSPAPVALVRPDTPPLRDVRTVLVPVDGSAGSALALGAAAGLARAAAAKLVLLQVVVPIPLYLYAHPFPTVLSSSYIDPAWDDEARASAQRYVEGLARRLRGEDLIVEARTAFGEAARSIVATADGAGADLIVMSTHGATGLERSLVGSVAGDVVRDAKQPVLLMRQPHAVPAEAVDAGEVPAGLFPAPMHMRTAG